MDTEKMTVVTLSVGIIGTCCYVLWADGREDCLVVDPGGEPERIRKAAGGRRIAGILFTHGHFDHIAGASKLVDAETRVLIHPLDAPMLSDPDLNAGRELLRLDVTGPAPTDLVRDGQELELAGLNIRVWHTPGHTPGSVCYEIGDHFFTGDTLFHHGWGRTDLPGGSEEDLFRSLRRILPLSKEKKVHPGHDA